MTNPDAGIRVNPSDETIRIGPLGVRFLVTGDDARASVAVFELTVPAAQLVGTVKPARNPPTPPAERLVHVIRMQRVTPLPAKPRLVASLSRARVRNSA